MNHSPGIAEEIRKDTEAPEDELHYQLYKLLAFAIQELSYFASEDRINDCLQLPQPLHTITNRAQMAVERIEAQNPHFFSGYVRFRRGKLYPAPLCVCEEIKCVCKEADTSENG